MIEDNFGVAAQNRETAGVQMVENVLPWEQMKLRMLNGSHSFLAYPVICRVPAHQRLYAGQRIS
ncbi:hypothetical protein ACNKHK_14375 [Shigella flexneri]